MSARSYHQDYADSIGHFCAGLPDGLTVQTSDVDAYFRSCTLSVWARSPGDGGGAAGINQIYTDRSVAFTDQQFQNAIAYYRGDMHAGTPMPDFFVKLVGYDKRHGSCYSRTFAEIQKNLLMLFAAGDGDFSFAESQEITRLYQRLTALCDENRVPPVSVTPGPSSYLGRREEQTLSGLLADMERQLGRRSDLFSDFWGAAPKVPAAAEQPAEPEAPAQLSRDAAAEAVQKEQEEPPVSLEDAMAELRALVGLEAVKRDVESLMNLVKVRNLRKERGMKCPDMSFHLVFSGNPGTGKTTVARIVGKIYRALGILSKGHLVEVDRSGLVAGYVGQTAIKTQEVIQKALGGVLFIDEAYSLAPANADKDFGQEAIDTILKAMEDHRDDFVVIVAGYESLMPRFIDSNPGLKSRFNKYITFDDYDGEALYEIFMGRVERSDYRIDSEAAEEVKSYLEDLYEFRDDNFGNARDVRNLFERIVAKQADRVAEIAEPTDEEILTITAEDLEEIRS